MAQGQHRGELLCRLRGCRRLIRPEMRSVQTYFHLFDAPRDEKGRLAAETTPCVKGVEADRNRQKLPNGIWPMFDTMTSTKILGAVCGALLLFLFAKWGR